MHCSCLAGCCTSTLVLLLPVLRKYLKGPHLLQCLSCRVLHKYPAFVAPGAAQVPTGASFFAVFVLQGAAQVPCFCCSRCCASTYRGLIFCSVSRFCFHRRNGSQNGSDKPWKKMVEKQLSGTFLMLAPSFWLQLNFALEERVFLLSDFWIIAKKGSLHT